MREGERERERRDLEVFMEETMKEVQFGREGVTGQECEEDKGTETKQYIFTAGTSLQHFTCCSPD